ncbi:phosphotransferase [Natronobacterium gregoryi]|uniref:phosphotransferase n=1 Tax=Natronobacterium gregoryi TaxID=44930 RepID=UPI002F9252F5
MGVRRWRVAGNAPRRHCRRVRRVRTAAKRRREPRGHATRDLDRRRHSAHRTPSALSGPQYGDVADAIGQFFREHPAVLEGAGAPVLCHGDVHPEHHVRTGDEEVLGIDFEHALVAPAEYDYWRTVIPYFEARDGVDERVERKFRDGYESVRSLPDDGAQRRPLYSLLNSVAFLESLHLQKVVDPEERDEMGGRIRDRALEILEEVRDSRG